MNKGKADASDPSVVDGAYVDAKDRVLDPDLLDKSLLDRLPQPTGWRLLVMPYQGASKTTGGLHIPDEVRDREAVATVVAYVLKLGPLAMMTLQNSVRRLTRGARKATGFVSVDIRGRGLR